MNHRRSGIAAPMWSSGSISAKGSITRSGKDDTAAAKMEIMRQCGIHVVESPAEIGQRMFDVLKVK